MYGWAHGDACLSVSAAASGLPLFSAQAVAVGEHAQGQVEYGQHSHQEKRVAGEAQPLEQAHQRLLEELGLTSLPIGGRQDGVQLEQPDREPVKVMTAVSSQPGDRIMFFSR